MKNIMSPEISKKLIAILILVPVIASGGIITFIVVINLPDQNQNDSLEARIQRWMTNAQIPSLGACIVINYRLNCFINK